MAEAGSLQAMHEEKLDEVPRDELDDDEEEKKSQLRESQQYVEFTQPESENLEHVSTVVVLPENGQCAGVQASLATESLQGAELKEQVEATNEETSPIVIASGSEIQVQTDHQMFTCPNPISELSPTSVTQSISAHTQPSPEHKTTILKIDDFCSPKDNKQGSLYTKSSLVVKTLIPDGYNWRKYGQKQVKSPIGSRSYYKCTRSDCSAKKIECSDHSGNLVEIVKRGNHTHDAPKRNDCTKEYYPSSAHTLENSVTEHLIATPSALAASTSLKHYIPVVLAGSVSESKRPASSRSEGTGESQQVMKEELNEPEPKRRLKKSDSMCSESIHKSEKKPKYVVHAAGDVEISGDGYRWRKYGQKMVKGNPHPRNYYRCTSAGCPVRKHIETAVDNASAVIVTYKGVHDHDTPVPKKRHGLQSVPLVAAAAPTSVTNTQVYKTSSPQNQKTSSTQWSVGSEGELTGQTLDVIGGEKKTIESARTLLSIGFEIKPC